MILLINNVLLLLLFLNQFNFHIFHFNYFTHFYLEKSVNNRYFLNKL
jgi:hypothetical protein